MMFPGARAQVIRNEAGEPIGWDYPPDDDGPDYDDRDAPDVEPFECKCGEQVWPDDTDAIVEHYEVCTEPESFWAAFGDTLRDEGIDPQHNPTTDNGGST